MTEYIEGVLAEARMILSFRGQDRDKFINEANQMFRLRARTFQERLGWAVSVRDGWEIDELDDLNPLYLLSLREGRVNGCLRLLPSTGPTLLSGALAPLFDNCVDVRSPLILEGTRFAVEDDSPATEAGVRKATAELLMAACETMIATGYSHMLGVLERATFRVCARTGWKPAVIGHSIQPKGIFAVLWEVNRVTLDRMQQVHGFSPEWVEDGAALPRQVG